MGNYNPYAPKILGQEWVPIRDEDVVFSPSVNSVELGHKFSLDQARQVRDARFYIREVPPSLSFYQVPLFNIYPSGTEDLTGPISQVIIPCNNGNITGAGISLNNSNTVAEAVAFPGDDKSIIAVQNAIVSFASFFFNINAYNQLANKRILNVSLIYVGSVFAGIGSSVVIPFIDPDPNIPTTVVNLQNDPATAQLQFVKFARANTGNLWELGTRVNPASQRTDTDAVFGVLNLGDVNHLWDPAAVNPSMSAQVMPWRYVDLQRLEASAANRLNINVAFQVPTLAGGVTASLFLEYMALRVIYCEERRVAYGGMQIGFPFTGRHLYTTGAFIVPLRNTSFNTDPILAAGDYSTTLSWVNPGDINGGIGLNTDFPKLNGLRQLYSLPNQEGVQINIPAPAESHLGETFTKVETQILPQISLHSSGGPLTEVHVYGRQAIAQVFGANTATQEIYDDIVGVNTVYNQVRYYARRFGDTTVPLTLTGTGSLSGSSVSITPADFDVLDEIINGWREVTLTFTTPPTMGTLVTTEPSWTWSATGELAGNRWEVLAACAPALSGIPGNLYNLVPSPNQLYEATYQPPGGSVAELTWMPQGVGSPPVTGATADDSTDAVLIFAVNPLPITGFTASTRTQEVTGIGMDCGLDPCCIPTDILYNRITWGLPVNTGVASDNFNRTVAAGGWGTASDGHVWTVSGTAANFSVNGAEGLIAPTATGSDRVAWVNVGGPEQDVQAQVKIGDTAETISLMTGLVARLTDANNYYSAEFRYTSTGTATLVLLKRVATVSSSLLTMTLPNLNPNILAWRNLRFQVQGSILRAKVWGSNDIEPDWMLSISDASLTTGNNAGCFARDDTAAAAPSIFSFESFTVNPPDYGFGAYELQRMDTVEADWNTIMRATNVATTGFSDFEARAGICSTYRIRGLNVYDFAGPWSSEVSICMPSPGISGGCLEGGHVLIFTSNERQDGSINLAYSSVWEGRVEEGFTFAEAGFVQLQAMYNRDFFTAFRPTERGGEQFQRTVLVQAAAIAPETLADFTSLRDMAWEDVSYICVRDEDGNRWFATVIVPNGKVTHSRKLYMAPVQIIEVTDTPSEVDP